jgi:hypothetical protein
LGSGSVHRSPGGRRAVPAGDLIQRDVASERAGVLALASSHPSIHTFWSAFVSLFIRFSEPFSVMT